MEEVTQIKMDDKLRKLISDFHKKLKKEGLRPDHNGDYFWNTELGRLREVLEMKGYTIGRHYQSSRIRRNDKDWIRQKKQNLIFFLEKLETLKLDLATSAFIVGHLNEIIKYEVQSLQQKSEEKAK